MRYSWHGTVAAICLVAAAAPGCSRAPQPVALDGGWVRGVVDGDVTIYKGVPFAAPPLGSLRWRAPRPVMPWHGVRDASEFRPTCMQSGTPLPGLPKEPASEDCLYLNIWSAADRRDERLPVMVWVHGGGYRSGSASTPVYWGGQLARTGVVVVNISYRLGPFGFLAHPELTRESDSAASGNYALLDAIAALQWVRRNIVAFGGDPDRITIFGHSAGSYIAGKLMISPLARGLFHRVIGQSGMDMNPVSTSEGMLELAEAERLGIAFAQRVGARSIAELRSVSAEKILAAHDSAWPVAPGGAGSEMRMIVDGYSLLSAPYDAFSRGQQARVPILIGYTANEGANTIGTPRAATEYVTTVRQRYGDLGGRILAQYPAGSDAEAVRSQMALKRDADIAWPVWTWARLHASTTPNSVYYYVYDHAMPYPRGSPMSAWGAAHGAELLYVFRNLDLFPLEWTKEDRRVSDIVSGYWTNFAKTGDPNGAGLPPWPAFTREREQVLTLGPQPKVGAVPHRNGLELVELHKAQLPVQRSAAQPRDPR